MSMETPIRQSDTLHIHRIPIAHSGYRARAAMASLLWHAESRGLRPAAVIGDDGVIPLDIRSETQSVHHQLALAEFLEIATDNTALSAAIAALAAFCFAGEDYCDE